MGAAFLQANRNKRSVVLDIKRKAGRDALLRLCKTADVFIHNVRSAAMKRAGLGEGDVRTGNARLIYVSLIGYREDGPYAGRPAYDDLMQGLSGIPALQAEIGGEDPRYTPLTVVDRIMGISAAHTVLAALVHRERSGVAQAVEVPMFESVAQLVLGDHMGGRTFEPAIGRPGYVRMLAPDRRPYPTKDGYVCVLIYNNKEWESFSCDRPERAIRLRRRRLSDHGVRTKHYAEVYAILGEILATPRRRNGSRCSAKTISPPCRSTTSTT